MMFTCGRECAEEDGWVVRTELEGGLVNLHVIAMSMRRAVRRGEEARPNGVIRAGNLLERRVRLDKIRRWSRCIPGSTDCFARLHIPALRSQ